LGIIGKSGSGKTTLISVIGGLMNPTEGLVRVDGETLNTSNSFGEGLGYLPQNPCLFEGSICWNVTFREESELSDAEMLRLDNAVDAVGLTELISKLKNGVRSSVGKFGGYLSGGQVQRLCLARELYREPSLLILDEPTSALDQKSQYEIQQVIGNLTNKVTLIVVSHKLETLSKMDSVVVLSDGALIERGSPDQMFKKYFGNSQGSK
jgi:ABC-type bacteriocin/lantibiotic exporter with double-glycine peptidase domain